VTFPQPKRVTESSKQMKIMASSVATIGKKEKGECVCVCTRRQEIKTVRAHQTNNTTGTGRNPVHAERERERERERKRERERGGEFGEMENLPVLVGGGYFKLIHGRRRESWALGGVVNRNRNRDRNRDTEISENRLVFY